jgi:hypothetical protein
MLDVIVDRTQKVVLKLMAMWIITSMMCATCRSIEEICAHC